MEEMEKIWKQRIEEFMNRPHGMSTCESQYVCLHIVLCLSTSVLFVVPCR